jgi:FemAB-related protein (PEP-CTERM system-associated)
LNALAEAIEPLVVRAGRPADDERRDAYVRAHPGGTFFHLAGWRRVIDTVHGHEPLDVLAWRGDRLVGVLPLMLCTRFLGRRALLSMPYAVYGGPLGDDPEAVDALVVEGQRLARELGVAYLELRCLEDPGVDLVPGDLYATFLRELPQEPSEVLKAMPKKARAEARKARDRHGLELGCGHWYVDDLQRMFLWNKRQLGSPALPAAHFHQLLVEFGRDISVHLVRRDGEPLSAVMSFAYGDTLIAYYAGTAPGADRNFSASNFMYLALQEWAVERGFRVFDFGRSRVDSGAFEFKRHQGFEPRPLPYRYHLERQRRPPSFTPSNPRTRLLREAWSRLPLWAARRLSDRLARYLP